MYPLGHLAVGYLAYSVAVRLLEGRTPADAPVTALAIGTQFPDLVDKPLAWWFGVLPGSRTLAHSIYVAVAVVWVVSIVATHLDQKAVGSAFGFGYLSHLLADALYPYLQVGGENFTFLAWPLTPPVTYVNNWELLTYLRDAAIGEAIGIELMLGVSVIALWIRDGKPGFVSLRRASARWRRWLARG